MPGPGGLILAVLMAGWVPARDIPTTLVRLEVPLVRLTTHDRARNRRELERAAKVSWDRQFSRAAP